MKRLLSLWTLLLCAVMCAWADTVVLSTPAGSVTTLSDANGIVTITDASGSTGIQQGSGSYKITYDGTAYVPMKLSASRNFTLSFKEGVTINKVTLLAMSNGDASGTVGAGDGDATSLGTFPARNKDSNCLTVDITGKPGLRGSRQFLVLIVVDYTEAPVGKTVTFQAPIEWGNVYVYAWDDNENKIAGEWPGTQLSQTDDRIYIWSTTEEPTKIIFNNGVDKQTADLEFKDGGVYNIDGRVITLNDYSATFTTDGMTEVWAYAWNGDDKPLGEWPGTQMTASGDGQFSIAIKAEEAPKYIIFHNNAGQKTDDLDFEDGKAYVYNLNDYTATFTTDAAWDKVYAYAWSGDTKFFGDFPGQELTATEGVYTLAFKAFKAPESILFNCGTDAGKTPDMGFTSGRKYVWNTTLNPLFKLEASDEKIPAGSTVEVKDKEDKVVATLTYGVEGGADFAAPVARANEEVAGFTAYTAGNGENGSATSGTVYTIKPVYDGTITVGVWLNGGKAFFIQEDDTSLEGFDGIKKDYGSSTSFTFDVKADKEYKVYCTGSKLGFYGFDYTYAAPAQPETKTYYVVGNDETVFGEAWNPGFEGNKMTANQDGSYTWTSAEVNFSKDEGVQFKITDGTWNENYGLNGEVNGANIFAKPTVDGANTLTITFNPTTDPKTISYEFAKEASTPIGENDIVINADDIIEGDITAALTAAMEGKETVGNITINLAEGGNYTLSNSIQATASLIINGNGATIDASSLNAPFINYAAINGEFAMKDETTASAYVLVNQIGVTGLTIKGLSNSIINNASGTKTLFNIVQFDNVNIELKGSNNVFALGTAFATNFSIFNSTIWSKDGHSGFFFKADGKPADVNAATTTTWTVDKSLLYNIAVGKKANNSNGGIKGKNTTTMVITNSILYNFGSSVGSEVNGWLWGQNGGANSTYANNAYLSADGVVTGWTDAEKGGSDQTGTSVDGTIAFTDAANGDFNAVIKLSAGGPNYGLGDPRWRIDYELADPVALANPEKLYIMGSCVKDWQAEDRLQEMTYDEEKGVFTYKLEDLDNTIFFTIGDVASFTDWQDFNNWHRYAYERQESHEQKGVIGTATQLYTTRGEGTINLPAGTWTISISKADGKMTITGEATPYTVAGAFSVDGVEEESFFGTKWEPTLADNDMTILPDYTYQKVYTGVKFEKAGTILFKVCKNHAWTECYGDGEGNNATCTVSAPCTATLTFTFNPYTLGQKVSCELSEVVGISSVKTIDLNDAPVFNLNGQRVNKAQKGLFIVGGKKVVRK